jgi:glycosyltransferase involved in cell wall biosynthesis
MNELRVAIFTGNYNHIHDGVSLTLNRLVSYLENKNIPVIVFGPTDDDPELQHNGEFVQIPSIFFPGHREYRLSMGLPKEARRKLYDFGPTLIHLATPDILGICAIRWAQRNNIKIVASYNTHFTSYLKYYHLGILERAAWKYIEWFYIQGRHVYAPSSSMAKELEKRDISSEISLWSRGVDTEEFSPNHYSGQWRRENGFAEGDIILTIVSRLVWEKNLKIFVKTAKKLGDSVKPVIVGNGPAMDDLQQMLPGALFTGFITGSELSCTYASSDIFLFPSETETFGNVTLEAMASGLPCVVADAPGSKSLVESGINGYLAAPHDAEEFAKYVRKIAGTQALREEMSKAARQKALVYSWDRVNSTLLENYYKVLHEQSPSVKF